jgi:hypothetical protein
MSIDFVMETHEKMVEIMKNYEPFVNKYKNIGITDEVMRRASEYNAKKIRHLYEMVILLNDFIDDTEVILENDVDYGLKMECNYDFDDFEIETIKIQVCNVMECKCLCRVLMMDYESKCE